MQSANERAVKLFPTVVSPVTGKFMTRQPWSQEVSDAIRAAVREAKEVCCRIAEEQRMKILNNPADPSWTEHLADVQTAIRANKEGE